MCAGGSAQPSGRARRGGALERETEQPRAPRLRRGAARWVDRRDLGREERSQLDWSARDCGGPARWRGLDPWQPPGGRRWERQPRASHHRRQQVALAAAASASAPARHAASGPPAATVLRWSRPDRPRRRAPASRAGRRRRPSPSRRRSIGGTPSARGGSRAPRRRLVIRKGSRRPGRPSVRCLPEDQPRAPHPEPHHRDQPRQRAAQHHRVPAAGALARARGEPGQPARSAGAERTSAGRARRRARLISPTR